MFFYKKKYKFTKEDYFLKDSIFLLFYIYKPNLIIFFFLRNKYINIQYLNSNLIKIIFFYRIYKAFIGDIKQTFNTQLVNILKKKVKTENLFKQISLKKNSQAFISFWNLKKEYFYLIFSFLHIFIGIDILKDVYFSNNKYFALFYSFQSFKKLFTKHKNSVFIFNIVWYLTNLYVQYFEKFIQKLSMNFIFKNRSGWKFINKSRFSVSLYYLYAYNNYSLYYIRSLNKIQFFLFSKVKYVLQVYKEIQIFLKYHLKIKLNYNEFNFRFVNKTIFLKKAFFEAFNSVKVKAKLKLRIFMLFHFNQYYLHLYKQNHPKSSQLRLNKLANITKQVLLQFVRFKNSYTQKIFFRQLIWLSKNFFKI